MNITTSADIAPRNCPYTIEGQNLAEIRRAQLRKVAQAVKVNPEGSKQEILQRVIAKLTVMDAPKELTNG